MEGGYKYTYFAGFPMQMAPIFSRGSFLKSNSFTVDPRFSEP